MLPCVCSVRDHRRRQNVVRTSVTHSATQRVPLFCSYHVLTSSVIYCWTDARQNAIYLLNENNSESLGEREMPCETTIHEPVTRVFSWQLFRVLPKFQECFYFTKILHVAYFCLLIDQKERQNVVRTKTSETISDSAECYARLPVRFESSAACM